MQNEVTGPLSQLRNILRKMLSHGRGKPFYFRQVEPLLCRLSVGKKALNWDYKEYIRAINADVYLISFPKCGRTWLNLLLGKAFELHFNLNDPDLFTLHKMSLQSCDIPKIFIIHDDNPHWKAPEELFTDKRGYAGKKVIFMVRDPRDVLVSLYFHVTQRVKIYSGNLSSFIYHRTQGSIDTIIRFYNIWEENKHVPSDFLLVHYEKLHKEPEIQLRKVMDFIGLSSVSDKTVKMAVQFAQFDNMKKMEIEGMVNSLKLSISDVDNPNAYKVRKGEVRGYINYLSKEEIEYLTSKINATLLSTFGY